MWGASRSSRKDLIIPIRDDLFCIYPASIEFVMENLQINQEQNQPERHPTANSSGVKVVDGSQMLPELIENDERFSGSVKTKKYWDVAHATQAAFESATYAITAARAAVSLSRSDSHDPDDQNSPHPRRRKLWNSEELMKSKNETFGQKESERAEKSNTELESEKFQPSYYR